MMDILLTGQWIFYTIRNTYLKRRQKQYENHLNVNGESATTPLATPSEKRRLLSLLIPCIFVVLAFNAMQHTGTTASYRTGRKLLQENPPIDDDNDGHCNWPPSGWQSILGYSIGCFSAVLYLVSRIPQLLKNVRVHISQVFNYNCSAYVVQLRDSRQSYSFVHFWEI